MVALLTLLVLVELPLICTSAAAYQRHASSYCAAITCHGARCTGNLSFALTATLPQCQARCEAESCACFEWRDPATHHPEPQQPSCLVTNRSTTVQPSGYGYDAYVNTDIPPRPPLPPAPAPDPERAPLYTTRGAIEVDTNENTMFMWHDDLYVLENMCVITDIAVARLAVFSRMQLSSSPLTSTLNCTCTCFLMSQPLLLQSACIQMGCTVCQRVVCSYPPLRQRRYRDQYQ